MHKAKKHHFVPRWYLEKFTASDGFLHVYDKASSAWRKQKPKEVMAISRYYEQSWAPQGIDPNILETALGNKTEPDGKKAFDLLLNDPHAMTAEHTAAALVYLELQRIRVPRQAEQAKLLLRGLIMRMVPQDAVEPILKGELKLEVKDSFRIEFMKLATGQFNPWFARMTWRVVQAEDDASFVTTDSPVTFFNVEFVPPSEPGIGLAGTMVLFPLTSKHLLLLEHPEYSGRKIPALTQLPDPKREDGNLRIDYGEVWDKNIVNKHNWTMMTLSQRLVVANAKKVLEECLGQSVRGY